jgi:multimeric flavodoxin WrbA
MQMTVISFSQNTSKAVTNSTQIGRVIQKLTHQDVDIINIKDYGLKPCHLCGKCSESKTCEVDSAFKKLLEDIKHPDLIFFVIPFYAPFPSKLMIFLEKLNEIFYASWLKDSSFFHPLQKAKVGLVTHGGLVDRVDVVKHYQTMLNEPMVKTLNGLGFKVIVDPKAYVEHRMKDYVEYVINQMSQ